VVYFVGWQRLADDRLNDAVRAPAVAVPLDQRVPPQRGHRAIGVDVVAERRAQRYRQLVPRPPEAR
jgi:hypothetical protein